MHYDVSDDSGDHAEHVLLRHLFDTTQSDASEDWDAVVSHRDELRSYQRDGLDCIFVDDMGLGTRMWRRVRRTRQMMGTESVASRHGQYSEASAAKCTAR